MKAPDFSAEPWPARVRSLLGYLAVPGGRSHAELKAWRREAGIKTFEFPQLLAHLDCQGWARTSGGRAPKTESGKSADNYSRAAEVRWYATVRVIAGSEDPAITPPAEGEGPAAQRAETSPPARRALARSARP